MSCEEFEELLVDRWNEELGPEGEERLREHLAECAGCAEEAAALDETWARLGDLEEGVEVPSDRMRARFYGELARLDRAGAGSAEPWHARVLAAFERVWPKTVGWQVAAAAATLVAGILLGTALGGEDETQVELARLRGDVETMGRVVAISLLDHPSASERLRGVSWGARVAAADDRVLGALLETVREDENMNVRLAAVEALAASARDRRVRSGLIEALPRQRSPLVQMLLLDLLAPEGLSDATDSLGELLEREDLDPAVRDRILETSTTDV